MLLINLLIAFPFNLDCILGHSLCPIKCGLILKYLSSLMLHYYACLQTATRSRSRSNITQDNETDASYQDPQQEVMPEEVLVISLGTSSQTMPGMMPENEVTHELITICTTIC